MIRGLSSLFIINSRKSIFSFCLRCIRKLVNAKQRRNEEIYEPEEAVLSYLAGLKENNFGHMLNTFGEGNGAGDIPLQYAYLCGITKMPEIAIGQFIPISGSEDAEKLLEQITLKIEETDFGGLEFLGFLSPETFTGGSLPDTYQQQLSAIAKANGGSELRNILAAIQIDENKYLLFIDTIKRDGRWFNFALGSTLAKELKLEEFEEGTAGTVRMDTKDEKMPKKFLDGTPDRLPESAAHTSASVQPRMESEGFGTPQQAASAYLEGLEAHDLEQMSSTFSIENYAEHYDLQAFSEYYQACFFMKQDVSLPPVNSFVKAMIGYERKNRL